MQTFTLSKHPRMLTAILGLASLTACGGGGAGDTAPVSTLEAPAVSAAQVETSTVAPAVAGASGDSAARGALGSFLLSPSGSTGSAAAGVAITTVSFEHTGTTAETGVPVTFGQVFVAGELPGTVSLVGKLADNTIVPLQLDVKAKHPDGSVRHAVISAVLPSLVAGKPQTMTLVTHASYPSTTATLPTSLLYSGFSAAANITLDGQTYTVSAETLLKDGKFTNWLAGPIVNEWHVAAPLKTSAGVSHPHLTARFAIRSYTGSRKTRVDVIIENNWAYEPAPQNFTYNSQILIGGKPAFSKDSMTHYHHARWRKLFWWGDEPQVHVRHNVPYLIKTRAVPNYDQTIVFPESQLASIQSGWTGARTEPMGVGLALFGMGAGGGRPDIGLLPGWAVTYLLSQDKRAKHVTMGTADLAGSWPMHYRNKVTDKPISLIDYPYMTVMGGRPDTKNPATQQLEAFPLCATTTSCTSPNQHDTSHQPSFAYLPYIVSGDHYYLEEMQFWAMYNMFHSNPYYRENVKGLVKADQVRGQAWSLRTLAQAAFISPDADPLKSQFEYFLNNNLDWYNENYTNNPGANTLGAIVNGHALGYNNGTGLAPWMDDFFTAAIGYAAELGFVKAEPLLAYKARFPISRMTGDGACWIDAAIYAMKVRDSATAPFYSTIKQAYQASHTSEFNALACNSPEMAAALKLKVGEMTGYAFGVTGYPSNMQPALAYSANVAGLNGANAWNVFNARTVKPNYAQGPQFAVIPR